jgi:hypothetical protein
MCASSANSESFGAERYFSASLFRDMVGILKASLFFSPVFSSIVKHLSQIHLDSTFFLPI